MSESLENNGVARLARNKCNQFQRIMRHTAIAGMRRLQAWRAWRDAGKMPPIVSGMY